MGSPERAKCTSMIRSEIDFTNMLKVKQSKRGWLPPTPRPKNKPAPENPTPEGKVTDIIRSLNKYKTTCGRPTTEAIFLKTHKTGSSTIINIIQRYASNHNLKIALPHPSHFLGWPYRFNPSRHVFEYSDGVAYNFICNHAKYDKVQMSRVFARAPKIITIVRDPLYQFESCAVYFNFKHYYKLPNRTNVIDAFFEKNQTEIHELFKKPKSHNMLLVKNPIAHDLNFDIWNQTDAAIAAILKKVKTDFHLILISDYMMESMLLLKDEFCWQLEDIVYFTMNKRPDKLRQKPPANAREKVRAWNKIDYVIFDYVNKTFWEKVRAAGPRFQHELSQLKQLQKDLDYTCLKRGEYRDPSQPWFPIISYKLRNDDIKSPNYKFCSDMIRPEISFTNLLKIKQSKRGWRPPTPKPKLKNVPPKVPAPNQAKIKSTLMI